MLRRVRKSEKGGLIALSQNKKADRNELIKQLEKGYKEMADINLELAQMCFEADNESLSLCEEKLTECE